MRRILLAIGIVLVFWWAAVATPPPATPPATPPAPPTVIVSREPVAADGTVFRRQPNDVQALFTSVWGEQAAQEWVTEHNRAISHAAQPYTSASRPTTSSSSENVDTSGFWTIVVIGGIIFIAFVAWLWYGMTKSALEVVMSVDDALAEHRQQRRK